MILCTVFVSILDQTRIWFDSQVSLHLWPQYHLLMYPYWGQSDLQVNQCSIAYHVVYQMEAPSCSCIAPQQLIK